MKAFVLLTFVALLAFTANVQGRNAPIAISKTNEAKTQQLASEGNFGSALFNFILAFNNIMPCGFAPWNLPVLAPFTLSNWSFDYETKNYMAVGDINNMVVTGLNDYTGISYNYDANSGRLTYDVLYNDIQLLGEYNINAWALVAGYNFTVFGYGPLNWQVKNLRLVGELVFAPSGNGVAISDFNLNFFVGDVINNSWNNNWDISFNNFFNRWSREFILMWVQQIQPDVDSFYNSHFLPKENESLKNVSMTEVINFLTQSAQSLNAAHCTSK